MTGYLKWKWLFNFTLSINHADLPKGGFPGSSGSRNFETISGAETFPWLGISRDIIHKELECPCIHHGFFMHIVPLPYITNIYLAASLKAAMCWLWHRYSLIWEHVEQCFTFLHHLAAFSNPWWSFHDTLNSWWLNVQWWFFFINVVSSILSFVCINVDIIFVMKSLPCELFISFLI